MEMPVYDWRSPVASMFYDYEYGKASYTCPAGVINGVLSLKRQFIIEDGELVSMFDSALEIQDEILKRMLSSGADGKMKNIVTTIQREQNMAIRDESADVLVVTGGAGSGKTSVALHRISYLLLRGQPYRQYRAEPLQLPRVSA
jgi:DNA helicase-2/ATP-dependent DNA helicase PcrA